MADKNLAGTYLMEGAHDEGNARCLLATVGDRFRYSSVYGWLHHNGRCWQREGADQELDLSIATMLKQRAKLAIDADREAIAKAAIPSARHLKACRELFDELVPALHTDFDNDPDTVNAANGEINLRTGAFTPHTPTQMYTYAFNAAWDAHADMSEWEDFITDVVGGGADMVRYLQKALGYSFTGYTSEECFLYLWGPPRSGKGTLTETILTLAGQPFAVETDFATFTAKRQPGDQNFDLAPLKPARVVFASESNANEWLNAAKLKRMTGGNMITCSFKYGDQFSYWPRYKIWLISNNTMQSDVDDDAIWGRARVLQFPISHLGTEDKALKRRMRSPANLSAVLRWIVEGARLWFDEGLRTPDYVIEHTQAARASVDYVQSWLDECTSMEPDAWTSNADLYKSYLGWCKNNGVTPKQQRGLSNALRAKSYPVGVQRKISGENSKGVQGLWVSQS